MLYEQAIDLLPEDGANWNCPALLDIGSVMPFLKWLKSNPTYAARLVDERWRIGVLESHIEDRQDWIKLRKSIEDARIEVKEYRFDSNDKYLVSEIQQANFANEASSLQSAQLLAYGRKYSDDGGDIRVISRNKGFNFIPGVQRYFLNIPDVGLENEESYMRAIASLDLDVHVKRAALDLFKNGSHVLAVQQATIAFAEEIRLLGVNFNLPFKDLVNDQPMVYQALECSEPNKNGVAKIPHIKLNDLKNKTEWSEQKGYHGIMSGVISAVRNPTAHTKAEEAFLQRRFGSRHTALKFLCLMSLLFEKLNDRVTPR